MHLRIEALKLLVAARQRSDGKDDGKEPQRRGKDLDATTAWRRRHADPAELQALVQCIAERIGRMLEKRGLIGRDCENAWLSSDPGQAAPLDDLVGHSITYRIAVGPRAGQKVFTLQTVPAQRAGEGRSAAQAADRGPVAAWHGVSIRLPARRQQPVAAKLRASAFESTI